jgi:hypothetical protein
MSCFSYDNLSEAPEPLRDDFDFVFEAVKHDGLNLQYASLDLQDEHEIVLAAVIQNGDAINFASDRLRADPAIRTWARRHIPTVQDNLLYSNLMHADGPETKSDDEEEDETWLNSSHF